jgi:hypothetical protein
MVTNDNKIKDADKKKKRKNQTAGHARIGKII